MRRAAGARMGSLMVRSEALVHWGVHGALRYYFHVTPVTSAPLRVRHAQRGCHLGSFGPSTEGKQRRGKGIGYEPGTSLAFFKDDVSYFPLSALPGNFILKMKNLRLRAYYHKTMIICWG